MALLPLLFFFLILNSSLGSEITAETRLPKNVTPQSYKINLEINPLEKNNYNGSVAILTKTLSDTNTIVLHAHEDMSFNEISIKTIPENEEIFASWNFTSRRFGFLTLHLTKTLKENKQFTITITYVGRYEFIHGLISQALRHEYYSNERAIGSGFEIAGTRNAFPCFDEPEYKTEISLIVRHPHTYTALSTMDVKESTEFENNGKWMKTTFNTTPKMSIYLLGIYIGKLDSINNQNNELSIHSKLTEVYFNEWKHSTAAAKFLLKASQNCMKSMEEYLGFEYELPKLSIVLRSRYGPFEKGIVSWGFISFEADKFLYDNTKCDEMCEREMTVGICQKIAKMWFGNRVTMSWWDSWWITEGFASYVSYKLAGMIYEDEEYFIDLLLEQAFVGVSYNKDFNTQKLVPIIERFSRIPEYELNLRTIKSDFQLKSAMIVRMFEKMIGKPAFHQTMKNYIEKFSGKVITSKNLLDELRISSNFNIPDGTIDMWVKNPGSPVVGIVQRENSPIVDLNKKEYSSSTDIDELKWYIPLNWASEADSDFNDTTVKTWMNPDDTVTIDLKNDNEWFILNKQLMGHYLVQYDTKNWMKISQLLQQPNFGGVDQITRAMLIESVNKFPLKDKDFPTTLNVLKYLKNETEYLPWYSANVVIKQLISYDKNLKNYRKFREFIGSLIEPLLKKMNVNLKDASNIRLIKQILEIGCGIDMELAQVRSNELLQSMIDNSDVISLKGKMLECAYVKATHQQRDNFPRDKFDKEEYLQALLSSDNEMIMKKFYTFTMLSEDQSTNQIKSSDILSLKKFNQYVPKYWMDVILESYDRLYALYGFIEMRNIMGQLLNNLEPRNIESLWTFLDALDAKYRKELTSDMLRVIRNMRTVIRDAEKQLKEDQNLIKFDELLSTLVF